jgi:cobalt-zinc-cadmium efflux system membrane fusion protein
MTACDPTVDGALRRLTRVALMGILLAGLPARVALGSEEHEHGEHEEADEHGHDDPGHDEHGHDEHGEKRAFTVEDFERFGVRLVTAGPGEVDVGLELPGEVRPNADRIAHIAPRFPGIVREVRKQTGDQVRAGDVLARVESENLATYEIRAAFDGTVIDRHIAPGEAATREQPAFIVADLSTVWVDIRVYQTALPQVSLGQPVVITASHGAADAAGTISYVSPIVDQATRTATARVVLPNPDGVWRPGLFVTATVFNPVDAAVVVPRRALQTIEGKTVVFVVEGDGFEARPVTLGRVGRSRAEIIRGLSAGERLADERSFLVKAELAKGEFEHDH